MVRKVVRNMRFILLFFVVLFGSLQAYGEIQLKVTHVILHKEKHKLELYAGAKRIKSYSVSLGSNPIGHKEQQGDGRTLEGKIVIPKNSRFC